MGLPVRGPQPVPAEHRPGLLGDRVVRLGPDRAGRGDLIPAHRDRVPGRFVQQHEPPGEGVAPHPPPHRAPHGHRVPENPEEQEEAERRQRARHPRPGPDDQEGKRDKRKQPGDHGLPPDVSLPVEHPDHQAALIPGGQLPGVRELRGVLVTLLLDAPLEPRAQPLLSLGPHLHHCSPRTRPHPPGQRPGRPAGSGMHARHASQMRGTLPVWHPRCRSWGGSPSRLPCPRPTAALPRATRT